ncbi:MAG: hypothetical protein U1E27_01035, partial [Kiritimatiellia bacterium]|nr:hypothetical protein [Kiritimatiellia bacterium]
MKLVHSLQRSPGGLPEIPLGKLYDGKSPSVNLSLCLTSGELPDIEGGESDGPPCGRDLSQDWKGDRALKQNRSRAIALLL